MRRLKPAAALIVLLAVAGPAGAQVNQHPIVHLNVQGGSGADLGIYGLNSWDRTTLGARARGMGGVFLATDGEAASGALNPAALTSLARSELTSESRYQVGSATGTKSPTSMTAPGFGVLPVSDYRPGLSTTYTYNELSFAMPIVLMGRRGGVALSYHRMIDFKNGEETRFKVQSPQGSADYGQGSVFSGGVDAITPAVALNLTDWISVGGALNFMNGAISESGNQGVTSFGMVVSRGGLSMNQDVYGTSLDLGTRIRVNDRIRIGAVVQTGHELKFRNGHDNLQPLPNTTENNTPILYIQRQLMDHDLSVPTKYGAGISWSLFNDRMTLGADYWNQAWSRSQITRNNFTTTVLFTDSTSLLNNAGISVIPGTGQVKMDAGLNDTHHIRLGMEYMIRKSDEGGVQIPLRIGFRNEPFTFANFDTSRYDAALKLVVQASRDSGTIEEKEARTTAAINNMYQNGAMLFSGSQVPATTLTAGTGVRVGTFSAEFAVARTTYTVQRVFLGAFADFTRSLALKSATENRSVTEFTITTSLRF